MSDNPLPLKNESEHRTELETLLKGYGISFEDEWWQSYWQWILVSKMRIENKITSQKTWKNHKKEIESLKNTTDKYLEKYTNIMLPPSVKITNDGNKERTPPHIKFHISWVTNDDFDAWDRIDQIKKDLEWFSSALEKGLRHPNRFKKGSDEALKEQLIKCSMLWKALTNEHPKIIWNKDQDYPYDKEGPFLDFAQYTCILTVSAKWEIPKNKGAFAGRIIETLKLKVEVKPYTNLT